jgi:demethoxyubiquinone hydroxylase (CLK1/Coq7/Cat5 family)
MKKLLSGITAMVLVLGLFTTGVQAKGSTYEKTLSYDQVVQMVEQTDKEILEEISNADDKANRLILSYESGNLSEQKFNKELDEIIKDLKKDTNKKAQEAIKEAAKSGVIVEPVWNEVQIGGRIVLVDPCRVVGP